VATLNYLKITLHKNASYIGLNELRKV